MKQTKRAAHMFAIIKHPSSDSSVVVRFIFSFLFYSCSFQTTAHGEPIFIYTAISIAIN